MKKTFVRSGTKEYNKFISNGDYIFNHVKFERTRNFLMTLKLYYAGIKSGLNEMQHITRVEPTASFNVVCVNPTGEYRIYVEGATNKYNASARILLNRLSKINWYYNDVFTYEVVSRNSL